MELLVLSCHYIKGVLRISKKVRPEKPLFSFHLEMILSLSVIDQRSLGIF